MCIKEITLAAGIIQVGIEARGTRMGHLLGPSRDEFVQAKQLLKPLLLITGYPSLESMYILNYLAKLGRKL